MEFGGKMNGNNKEYLGRDFFGYVKFGYTSLCFSVSGERGEEEERVVILGEKRKKDL